MTSNGSMLTSESMTHTFITSPLRSSRIISLPSLVQRYLHIPSMMTHPSWSLIKRERGSTARETAPPLPTPVHQFIGHWRAWLADWAKVSLVVCWYHTVADTKFSYRTGISRINKLYLNNATLGKCYCLETYHLTGPILATAHLQLHCYFVTKCNFPTNPAPSHCTNGKMDIHTVSDTVFLEEASNPLEIYQTILWNFKAHYGPIIKIFEVKVHTSIAELSGIKWVEQPTSSVCCQNSITSTHSTWHTKTLVHHYAYIVANWLQNLPQNNSQWDHDHLTSLLSSR